MITKKNIARALGALFLVGVQTSLCTDVMTDPHGPNKRQKLKELEEAEKTGTQSYRKSTGQQIQKGLSEKEILKGLNGKVIVLRAELPKIITSFKQIQEALKIKALAHKDSNFEYATELATISSHVFALSKSADIVLGKVNADNIVHKSLAIIAAGALKDHIDELITSLEKSKSIDDITLTNLKDHNARIQKVTEDIDMKKYTLSEEKE